MRRGSGPRAGEWIVLLWDHLISVLVVWESRGGGVLFPGGGFSLYSAPRAGVCQDRRLVFWLHSWYNGKKQSCVPDMPHSAGTQENGSGTLPCQRRSHAQGSIFRRGPQTGPGRAAHHSPETHVHPGNPAYHSGTGVPVGGDFPQLFLCLFPHQGGSDRRGALSAAAPPAGICPQPDGRPVDQLAGRGAAVPGYLLLWRQEWSGGAQRG